jgi:hypothetical protein
MTIDQSREARRIMEFREAQWFMSLEFMRQLEKARCPDTYLDRVLQWAQQGDLDPLAEIFENRKSSLRLKPAMLELLAKVLRRAKKSDKNVARMATGDRHFQIATFVQMRKGRMGLTKAYQEAAKNFGYIDTRQIRRIYTNYRKLCMSHLEWLEQIAQSDSFDKEQKAGAKILVRKYTYDIPFLASKFGILRYEIDAQGLKEHFFAGTGN